MKKTSHKQAPWQRRGSQAPHEDLPPPHVPSAYEGEIDPFTGDSTVRVDVPFVFEHMGAGTRIDLWITLNPPFKLWSDHVILGDNPTAVPHFECEATTFANHDGGEATFDYEVDKTLYSQSITLTIRRTGRVRPSMPGVEGTVDDAGYVLRMEDLNGGDVRVVADDARLLEGDEIQVLWAPVGSAPYETLPQTVEADGKALTFEIPYDEANHDGRVNVSYLQTRTGAPDLRSHVRNIRVEAAEAAPLLPAPRVREAVDFGAIIPWVGTLHVDLPADGTFEPGDTAEVHWVEKSGKGSITVPVTEPLPGLEASIPVAVLAFALDEDVQISYTRIRNGSSIASQPYTVHVYPFEPGQVNPIRFDEQPGFSVDMGAFTGDVVHLSIEQYYLAANNQKYWLSLDGFHNGAGITIPIATGAIIELPVEGDRIQLGEVSRASLMEFDDRSVITMRFKVTFDQSEYEEDAVSFSADLYLFFHDGTLFLPPSVDGVDGDDTLNPNSVAAITVRLPTADPWLPHEPVTMYLSGDPRPTLPRWSGSLSASPGNALDVSALAAAQSLGKKVLAFYHLSRYGQLFKSEEYVVNVLAFPGGVVQDPAYSPAFTAASDDQLLTYTFSGDAHIALPKPHWMLAEGQRYWLAVTGERDDGSPLRVDLAQSAPITFDGEVGVVLPSLPRDDLMQFAHDSPLTLEMFVAFDMSEDRSKATRFPYGSYRVFHHADALFAAPTLDEADDDAVDPLNVTRLTARFPADATFLSGDTAEMLWIEMSGRGTALVPVPVIDPLSPPSVAIPMYVLAFALGEMVTLSYIVNRGSERLRSEAYEIEVKAIPPEDPSLTPPVVREARGLRILDLSTFEGDGHIDEAPLALFAPGQRYWLNAEARSPGGEITRLNLAVGEPLPATGAPLHLGTIPRAWLQALEPESNLFLHLSVTFDGSPDFASAIPFVTGHHIVRHTGA